VRRCGKKKANSEFEEKKKKLLEKRDISMPKLSGAGQRNGAFPSLQARKLIS